MKPFHGAAISAEDMEFVYHAVLKYRDDLEQYLSWLKTKDGKPLPGADIAIAEVAKEVTRYRTLALDLYRKCFIPAPGMVEEPSSKGDGRGR